MFNPQRKNNIHKVAKTSKPILLKIKTLSTNNIKEFISHIQVIITHMKISQSDHLALISKYLIPKHRRPILKNSQSLN